MQDPIPTFSPTWLAENLARGVGWGVELQLFHLLCLNQVRRSSVLLLDLSGLASVSSTARFRASRTLSVMSEQLGWCGFSVSCPCSVLLQPNLISLIAFHSSVPYGFAQKLLKT